MYYVKSIAELIKVSSSMEYQRATKYPWKWHIPMKTQIFYNFHRIPWYAPTGTLNATARALCSGPTARTTNELEYIFIRIHPLDVIIPLVYSEQQKPNFRWMENFHLYISLDRIDYSSIQKWSFYIWTVQTTHSAVTSNKNFISFHPCDDKFLYWLQH